MSVESIEEYDRNISECVTDDNIASDLIVAVMTVCGNLGSSVGLLKIFDLYMEGSTDANFELNYVPNSKKSKDGKKNKAFYNCLSALFYFKDSAGIESKIAAKVFPNGSIQLAGCRTIEAVYKAPEVLFNFISGFKKYDIPVKIRYEKELSETLEIRSQFFGKCEKYQKELLKHANENITSHFIIRDLDNFDLTNIRISMINSNFVFQHKIDNKIKQVGIIQDHLKDLINNNKFEGKEVPNRKWRIATYQPEKYAGVNIKYWTEKARNKYASYFAEGKKLPKKIDGQISIFVFRSGKGTITAAKNSKDLLEAYRAICNLVRGNTDNIFHNPNATALTNIKNNTVDKPVTIITGSHKGQKICIEDISKVKKGTRLACANAHFENIKNSKNVNESRSDSFKVLNPTSSGVKSYFTIG